MISGTTRLSAEGGPFWQRIPGAPLIPGGRHEDGSFPDGTTGWIVNSRGEIWRTGDGGDHWIRQALFSGTYLRCIGFSDTLHGWTGSIGYGSALDTIPLFKTSNGGWSWDRVSSISGPGPEGLCGIWVADSQHIYAVGRYGGPARFLSSRNGGLTWQSQDMSAYASALIDCFFFSADSGIIVGQTGSSPENAALVLFTPDGGMTWDIRHISGRKGILAWKIFFAAPDTGFVSTQAYDDSVTYLQTTDRGKTWAAHTFNAGSAFSAQGIGFTGGQLGWIGPHPQKGILRNVYETHNGGRTWQPADFGRNINRFRMLSDTLGYAIGETIYKYTGRKLASPVSAQPLAAENSYQLLANYPNPFNSVTRIGFTLPAPGVVLIGIFDITGRLVRQVVHDRFGAGQHAILFDAGDLSTGVYICRITAGSWTASRKMVLIR